MTIDAVCNEGTLLKIGQNEFLESAVGFSHSLAVLLSIGAASHGYRHEYIEAIAYRDRTSRNVLCSHFSKHYKTLHERLLCIYRLLLGLQQRAAEYK